MKNHISATIITFNEQNRVEACIDSLAGVADEIIVVDAGSSDATVEICRRRGCRVVTRRMHGYGAQRQFATSLATHSYVLAIDADECLSPALSAEIIRLKEAGFKHRGYCFPRLNFFCGEPVRHSGWYPDVQVRLFDKRYANWNLREVAERVIFHDQVRPCRLSGDLLHYRCDTIEEYVATQRRHAALSGQRLAEQNKGSRLPHPLLAATKAFLKNYIADGAFMDGPQGRAIARETFKSTYLAHQIARRLIDLKKADSSK